MAKHKDRAHALLSASGAHRWLKCTPSARYEEQFEDEDSVYSLEGTEAHELSEKILKAYIDGHSLEDNKTIASLRDDQQPILDYVGYVKERIEYYTEWHDLFQVTLEERLDFSRWVPDGFGTGDVVIIYDNTIEVIDLKYGKGVPVSAINNPQLRLYGLGAYSMFDEIFDFDTVRMTIVQPRLDSVSTEELSVEELLEWAETEVAPKAKLAFEGKGEFNPGDHCRFCKARFICEGRKKQNMEIAKLDFNELGQLTNEQVADLLPKIDAFESWAKDVKAYALAELLAGRDIPGYKLVEGRANRRIVNPDELAQKLIDDGQPEAMIFERKMVTLTKLESLVGKKVFTAKYADYIEKPQGAPTLAPISDRRPAINSAVTDFAEIESK